MFSSHSSTRYGCDAINEYKDNLKKLFGRLQETVPDTCLVIWNTTLPIGTEAKGGFLIPEIQFLTTTLRLDVLEANFYAQKVCWDSVTLLSFIQTKH